MSADPQTDNARKAISGNFLALKTKFNVREQVRAWKSDGLRVAFVPTMGALHEGHLDLVRLGLSRADRVIASIFVNPTQFAPGEDLASYPRTLEDDLAKLSAAGCHAAYIPSAEDMYPNGLPSTSVLVPGVSEPLEGAFRPHFFGGVATVVARLFLHVEPDIAVFGEKDYQQLQVIRQMVAELGFEIEIVGAPTRREADGLAMSSRNRYLSSDDRRIAGALFAALHRAARRIEAGQSVAEALGEARAFALQAGFTKLDYIEACDSRSLQSLPDNPVAPGFTGRLLAAAWIGKTRLIDNISFQRG